MDVGAATAQNPYRYQTGGPSIGLSNGPDNGPSPATATAPDGTDPFSALTGGSSVSALAFGISTVTPAAGDGGGSAPAPAGLETGSSSALLAALAASADPAGQQSSDPATNGVATVAIAAYQAQQGYPGASPAAQGSSAPTTTFSMSANSYGPGAAGRNGAPSSFTATTQDPNTAAYVQQAVQAALNPASMSLLA